MNAITYCSDKPAYLFLMSLILFTSIVFIARFFMGVKIGMKAVLICLGITLAAVALKELQLTLTEGICFDKGETI
jgi:hypothetical protein